MIFHYLLCSYIICYIICHIYIYHSSFHIILYGVLVHDAPLNIEVYCGSLYDTSTTYWHIALFYIVHLNVLHHVISKIIVYCITLCYVQYHIHLYVSYHTIFQYITLYCLKLYQSMMYYIIWLSINVDVNYSLLYYIDITLQYQYCCWHWYQYVCLHWYIVYILTLIQ